MKVSAAGERGVAMFVIAPFALKGRNLANDLTSSGLCF